ncbi:DUF3291 domain-containing protein [Sphaerisporangium flaviroseum]|uniref:DUF3291 domain-containing protein n=1 Tax=Sphaerisporangium flaviroseum TaxID=509199 RepID=UPI003CD0A02E
MELRLSHRQLDYLRRRREWFLSIAEPYSVMWWIPEGHTPTLADGMARLDLLRAKGPTPRPSISPTSTSTSRPAFPQTRTRVGWSEYLRA